MPKRIGVMVFIYICTCAAWVILGSVTTIRTETQDIKLKEDVGQLWGTVQKQCAPQAFDTRSEIDRKYESYQGDEKVIETRTDTVYNLATLESSDITVGLNLAHRKKGLLWYSTYTVAFSGRYVIKNGTDENRNMYFRYDFPSQEGIYDDFVLAIDGKPVRDLKPRGGRITETINLDPGQEATIDVSYKSQGMDEWWYVFGSNVSQIRDFSMTMTTDFDDINFPDNSMSPTGKRRTANGWELDWQYSNLISGIQIGMDLPQRLNPGPFVGRVTFFAPVSLFLFMFLMFIITTLREIKIHPMNYFFISCAFFSFHLLLAYLADHINIYLAVAICSVVSIFLVTSYMRMVVGLKFALIETGLSQFVYLVLFACAFFLEGYTGLSIAILCILTLFVVMQYTGRIDWETQFARVAGPKPPDRSIG